MDDTLKKLEEIAEKLDDFSNPAQIAIAEGGTCPVYAVQTITVPKSAPESGLYID